MELFERRRFLRAEVERLQQRLEELKNRAAGDEQCRISFLTEAAEIETRLCGLRLLRSSLRERSDQAARRRMITLGHLDP